MTNLPPAIGQTSCLVPLCWLQSNPYPFNVSRILHCLLVKSLSPGNTLHVKCQFNSSFFFQLIKKKRKNSGDGERVSKHLLCFSYFVVWDGWDDRDDADFIMMIVIVVWDGWDDRDDADFIMMTSLSYRIVPSW